MKCCKVVVTSFGQRQYSLFRRWTGRVKQEPLEIKVEVEGLLKRLVEAERMVDPGVESMDVILVVNGGMPAGGCLDLMELADTKCAKGRFRVISREDRGMMLGGYDAAFQVFGNEYDWWFFSPDDMIPMCSGYYRGMVDLAREEDAGFVGVKTLRWSNGNVTFYQGMGLTSRDRLMDACRRNGSLTEYDLPFGNDEATIESLLESTMAFSDIHTVDGRKLVEADGRLWSYKDVFNHHHMWAHA